MVMLDDSTFSEQDRLLVRTVIAYAKREAPFAYVRHVIEYGTLPPNRKEVANG